MKKLLLLAFSIISLCTNAQTLRAMPDTFRVLQANTDTFAVTHNDSIPAGDSVCITLLDTSARFSVLNCTSIIYQPDSLFTGRDSVRYVLCDTAHVCDTAMVVIYVDSYLHYYHYIPMPTTVAQWVGINQGMMDGLYFMQFPYSEYMQGDTLINGITYKSINDQYNRPSSFLFGMREDSTRKVYIIYRNPSTGVQTSDTFEHLMYDFNMQVGQSFYDTLYNWKPTVISIDTVLTLSGLRRRFAISNKASMDSNMYDYWIEGVGSLKILNHAPLVFFEVGYCLSYLTVQGQMTYQDTLSCFFTGITEIPLANIKMYPIPADQQLTIDMRQNSDPISANYAAIIIYNAFGQKLRTVPRRDSSRMAEINVKDLPDGVYVATITDTKGAEMMLGKFTIAK